MCSDHSGDERGKCHLIAIAAVLFRKVCVQNVGLLFGHRQTRWINIEATLVNRSVVAVDTGVEV